MFVVPIGVVAVTLLALRVALDEIAQLALTVVAVEVIPVQVTPPPEMVTAVAPAKFVPVRVTGTVVPWVPEVGLIEVSLGPWTVKVRPPLVPAGVVTLTVLDEAEAVVEMVNVAVIVVEFTTVTALTVTPDPDTDTVVPVAAKFVPVRVTGTTEPRKPEAGVTAVNVGVGGASTVNVTVLLVPPGVVVMLTVLEPVVAEVEIVNVAVTVVSFTTVRLLEVTPEPDTVIAVAPVRPVPVRVTGTLVPRTPELGAIVDSTGPNTVNVCVLLIPPAFATLTFLELTVALAEIVNVAVIVVEFTTLTEPTVTPVPDTATIVPVKVKFVPVSVTRTLVERRPLLGATEDSVGIAGLVTVSVKL